LGKADELRPWLTRARDRDGYWIMLGTRKIAYIEQATLDRAQAERDPMTLR
jgi:hypothetical protein